MNISGLFKALQIMGFVSSWSSKALEDGKVTLKEGIGLVEGVCKILDIPLELDVIKETKLDEEGPDLHDSPPDSEVVEETKIDEDVTELKFPSLDGMPDQ